MARIPQSFIDDLLNRLDIVEVVDHRVKLKKNGKNYAACCPFHEEKTPSFTVSPDKQFYYCFGCGASGNAIGFLMEYERQSFVESVETLAKSAGLEVPREETPFHREQYARQKNLYDVLEKASSYYQLQLKENRGRDKAVRYLQNRGLSGHIARDFGLGFAPGGWDNLLTKYGLSEQDIDLLVGSGLVIRRAEDDKLYDRFRNRIMFHPRQPWPRNWLWRSGTGRQQTQIPQLAGNRCFPQRRRAVRPLSGAHGQPQPGTDSGG